MKLQWIQQVMDTCVHVHTYVHTEKYTHVMVIAVKDVLNFGGENMRRIGRVEGYRSGRMQFSCRSFSKK